MIRLLKLIIPVWPAMLAAVILSVMTISSNVGLMGVSAFLIATAALHPPMAAISTAVVGVRFFGIARALCRYCERYVSHAATFALLGRLRVEFFRSIEPLAPAGLGRFRPGDLLSRMAADVESLQFFYLRVFAPPAVAVLTFAGIAYGLSFYSPKFVLVLLGGFITGGVFLPVFIKHTVGLTADEAGEMRGHLSALVVDSVHGAAELLVFGCAENQAKKVSEAGERFNKLQQKSARAIALADSLGSLTTNLSVWLLLVMAIPMVRAGEINGIDLAVLVLVIESSFEAVQPLSVMYLNIIDSSQAAGRLFSVIDTKAFLSTSGERQEPDNYDLEFNKVSFSYEDQTKVLDEVSFKVSSGRRVAIIGESGAGKSSIVSLLVRFWDCDAGVITLGGKPLRDYHADKLRDMFGVVQQAAYIFNASIRDNILLAKPAATPDELQQAIEAAALMPMLAGLTMGLDTIVGENGSALSGGQRQRIAIARALLKNAPILILDEPTTGLDAVTEREVMADIKSLMAGHTTILITHRLIGLEGMDEIIVLDNGKTVERGTYSALINQKGLFYKMWQQQTRMFKE